MAFCRRHTQQRDVEIIQLEWDLTAAAAASDFNTEHHFTVILWRHLKLTTLELFLSLYTTWLLTEKIVVYISLVTLFYGKKPHLNELVTGSYIWK